MIAGLEADHRVELFYDVPSRLPGLLDAGRADVALVPIVDVLRSEGRYRVLSDACIGCDGETMTVRVFSQRPPDRIRMLWVDGDSHTSVVLAKLLWRELYDRDLELRPLDSQRGSLDRLESVLLIGDKVVNPARGRFAYEVDLGGAWRQHTGLPFVFAVWATRREEATERRSEQGAATSARRPGPLPSIDLSALSRLLGDARDRGVTRAAEIAEACGPELGWPVELARRYLGRCLTFKLDAAHLEGAQLFARLCAEAGLIRRATQIRRPENLLAPETV